MKVAVFSAQKYDQQALKQWADPTIDWLFLPQRLDETSVKAAAGYDAICAFVNDQLNAEVLQELKSLGIHFVALRCAGFNQVDLEAAKSLQIQIARVPAYPAAALTEVSSSR